MRTPERENGSALASDILERIGRTVGESANVSAVFGEAVACGGITVIPVARARFGFGGGAGVRGDDGSGGGGGGGGLVSPVGYIEVHDRTARFKRIPGPVDLLALAAVVSLAALALRRLLAR